MNYSLPNKRFLCDGQSNARLPVPQANKKANKTASPKQAMSGLCFDKKISFVSTKYPRMRQKAANGLQQIPYFLCFSI
jgi:hypothetical protein